MYLDFVSNPKHSKLKDIYRYGSHSFVEKRIGLPLQAADLLAWQYATNYGRSMPRLDFDSLIQHPHHLRHYSQDDLQRTFLRTALYNAKPEYKEALEKALPEAYPQFADLLKNPILP